MWDWVRQALGLHTVTRPYVGFDDTESEPMPIDQMISQMWGTGLAPRVSLAEALTVPTVLRGRNLLCSVATLPLVQLDPDNRRIRSPFLAQIDPDVPDVVTLAQTIEDLVFSGIAWWRITSRAADRYPLTATRVDPLSVSLNPPDGAVPSPLPGGQDPRGAVVWINGQPVPVRDVIRFDSPNPAVLSTCGRAIRRLILFDTAAGVYAEDFRPLDYFSPAQGADPVSDDEIV